MNHNDYLTEEQLLALIDTCENHDMLPAPRHLKSNILSAVSSSATLYAQKKRKQFISYCLRTGFACAACLTVLFSAKPDRMLPFSFYDLNRISQSFTQFSDEINAQYQHINTILSDFVNGGITYE